jgi:hypothetical protein
MQWWDAHMAGTDPNLSAPRLDYMLQGGSDPSNTDPFAAQPAAGEDWVECRPTSYCYFPASWTRASSPPIIPGEGHTSCGPVVLTSIL